MHSHRLVWRLVAAMFLLAPASICLAIDTIYLHSTDRPVGGTISAVTKTDVSIDVPGSGAQTIPANDIREIEWEGEPALVKRARSEENGGQYASAIVSYQQALDENPANANVRLDLQFYLARTTARMALADPAQIESAKSLLSDFVNTQRNHYRFYEAQMWLGDVSLASDDLSTADESFNSLVNSPWLDFQMAGKIGMARVLLSRNDLAGARQAFDEVVNTPTTDDASKERRLEAMVGQAHVLQLEQSHDQAISILDQVIDESGVDDTTIQAEAYLRQGTCLQAIGGDPKAAIMAYLHVDVIPALSKESDFHAEALYQLSQLWTLVGDAARAADAADRLKTLYPNSEWAAK